ncbi:hypothetical protein BpHYR1_008467 [Brachionus plicatilis]|uniref:Uncharacterized protein n=1 Tax=Brachionus plicatilis TaxID=10195 RepID=A0A3M7S9Z3_BRAPC|nr:hypothetical protein BpHYR1_008467 [Brachionus plicatilis]
MSFVFIDENFETQSNQIILNAYVWLMNLVKPKPKTTIYKKNSCYIVLVKVDSIQSALIYKTSKKYRKHTLSIGGNNILKGMTLFLSLKLNLPYDNILGSPSGN